MKMKDAQIVDHVIVTGRLAPNGKRCKSTRSARAMVDRLDAEYGAASHTYRIVWRTIQIEDFDGAIVEFPE